MTVVVTEAIVLYVAYIGGGLVKVGYSDGRILARTLKHQNSESQFPQWRLLKVFEISGRPMEKKIDEFLIAHKAEFNKQKEIFKPPGTLTEFLRKL